MKVICAIKMQCFIGFRRSLCKPVLVRAQFLILTSFLVYCSSGEPTFQHRMGNTHRDLLENNKRCCPPGYVAKRDSCVCGSVQNNFQISRCDENITRTYIAGGTWVGYVPSTDYPGECAESNTSLYFGTCPNGYCVNEGLDQILLPHNRSAEELDLLICGETRTGILCGKCRDGFGPGVNLFLAPCVDCKNDPLSQYGWLLWISLEFVPLCVMLFIVLYFNIDFLSGPFISYWMYAQIINASFPVSTIGPIPIQNTGGSVLLRLLFIIFYGIFDLQFFTFLFPPFCLTSGGSKYDKLDMMVFKSMTRIFPLVVIVLFFVYHAIRGRGCFKCLCDLNCKCFENSDVCRWMTKKMSFRSALQGLAAFFILVYTRFLTYCGNLFQRATLISSNPNAPTIEVVHLQGETYYFQDAKHIIYSTFTLLFILFIILPPIILLLLYPSLHQIQQLAINSQYKVLRRVFKHKVFGMFNTPWVQLFADLFQSSYKNKYRFFAGVLLLTRIAIIMVWNVAGSRSGGFAVLATLSLCLLMLHALLQPNIKNWINVLDTLIYTYMTAISILASYIYSKDDNQVQTSLRAFYVAALFLPALYPVLYLSRKLYFKLRWQRCSDTSSEGGEVGQKENEPKDGPLRPNAVKTTADLNNISMAEMNRHNELWLNT